MPYRRAEAPASLPDAEIIESLLTKRNTRDHRTRRIRKLSELTDDQRERTGLLRFGKRKEIINGDPYALYPYRAGNEMVMNPIIKQLKAVSLNPDEELIRLQELFREIPTTGTRELARTFSDDGEFRIIHDTPQELSMSFSVGAKTVRILQSLDVDRSKPQSVTDSERSKASEKRATELIGEDHMPIHVQQYLAATIFRDSKEKVPLKKTPRKRFCKDLRNAAKEHYWLSLSNAERTEVRKQSTQSDEHLKPFLETVRDSWQKNWTNNSRDPDYFKAYLTDQAAGESVWELVSEDLFIATDINRQILLANFEQLTQSMYGQETADLLLRCLDMWSFYTPLPAPETGRHVLDNYIRRLHPELDMEKATVETLPNAKMAVPGDPHGETLYSSWTTAFAKSVGLEKPVEIFPSFCEGALGKATEILKFLIEPLAPKAYAEAREVWENLEDQFKLRTTEENFITLFVLGVNGYTQRHRDTNDIQGGVAGLLTLGNYTGGNLCVPELGVKLPYKPGTAAIIAGDVLDHLVLDYSGPRFFIIGTNHDAVKEHVHRKMGKLAPLDEPPDIRPDGPDPTSDESDIEEDDGVSAPCYNWGDDDHDSSIVVTNTYLHDGAALHSSPDSEANV